MKGKGVEGIRSARTEGTRINGHEGDVLGRREGGLGGGERLGETAPRSGQHSVGMSNGKRLRADARSTQQRLLGGGILGEGGFLSGGLLSGRFEVAVDGDVNVLIETGIGLETGFRFGTTFDYMEIMMEETESPFNAFRRVIVFEGVSEFLGGFDELAVCYTGC